ncbi:LysM peptidoglycan-binding domain-containing protein [Ruminococcus sp.]|mgnify:FL=1|jgi:LysM repeat protein|uniref:LysM peptidoglycan-binding domain-containing protein n=1 Tax=Ruminococcus sp. TaxID=41978 RepID=UPI00204B0E12|nr:LysM peptidoglycan-binding domain-containing protein [Ruminococcus sp.]MEE0023899.1 LysM peptidoglycan-binding domain-containing protein [Ruminococcus sp.]DAV76679.1 MAG TPA: tail assembly protein [Caudoviricetes sp.]
MAYINQYYVFVDGDGETTNRSVSISDHPVEDGMVITDNVKREPLEIRLSGKLVGDDAETIKSNLYALMKSGSYVRYIGKEILSNAVILSFDTGRSIETDGGMSFDMTIREIRVAKNAYTNSASGKTVKSGMQQITRNNKAVYHTVRNGDTLYGLSRAYYGTDQQYVKLYEANSAVIEAAARDAGYVSSDGGAVLIAGTKLLIP